MTNFSIFESNLSGYFGGNVKRSHIEDLIEEGYDSVLLTISEKGSIVLRFSGKYSSIFSFRNLAQFRRESEKLKDLEGLVYALVTACDSAEKASNILVPKSYSVEVIAESPEVFYHKLQILEQ